ncbi:bifunctional tetrahydrofolate synthase/dihydrofolate synthase [Sutterella sp.]|uniref:bifunctional tetrahydrofolate synthase/dihydrofolate synthase n=1 Tax=Sutterella sp. TaxID=1981025 RepID=UPI0026DFC15B|nr:bifunctional tetrahydrofolate synthase/dihydrofolate synthase [Sutterella sp.]MDO5531779.1 bifunctional tetrahydrofolate synthase/dihydrofolate synthase [Sutterella sp.]
MPRTLGDWLTYIEKLHEKPIDLGLERMREMVSRMGIRFDAPVVTVAGTNGKGSTCAFVESVFRAAGYRTAMHTSPHLLRFNERALLDGKEVSDDALIAAFEEVEQARDGLSLSYFEYTGLAILRLFQKARPDVVILEIGLGGRLDAMNTIDPDVSVVAAVGVDHTAFLGPTREVIAVEKAHIYRPGRPAICSDPEPPATLVAHAERIGADLRLINRDFSAVPDADGSFVFRAGDLVWHLPQPGLAGENQYRNAAGALAAVAALSARLPVTEEAVARGIAATRITARFELITESPCPIIIDVGHNPQAAEVLARNLARGREAGHFDEIWAVFGMLTDKDRTKVISTVRPEIDRWFYAGLPGPRGGSAEDLGSHLAAAGVGEGKRAAFATVREALNAAREAVRNEGRGRRIRIIVFGSFVTVGEALEVFAEEGIRR